MREAVRQHPWLTPPTMDDIERAAVRWGVAVDEAAERLLRMRNAQIFDEEHDALRHGWEPHMWKVADALLGWPRCRDPLFNLELTERGTTWEAFSRQVRERLEYREPVTMLLVMGGNRSGKSNYSAKRGTELAVWEERKRVLACYFSGPRSTSEQMPLFYKYLPPELKLPKGIKSAKTYIVFKEATGFSQDMFITPNDGVVEFTNYTVDWRRALEGREEDLICADELVPLQWVEAFPFRLATRSGKAIVTFTPVDGWTPSVNLFLQGAKCVMDGAAYLLPRAGQPRDEALALGLNGRELMEVLEAKAGNRTSRSPQARGFDVWKWLAEPTGAAGSTEGVELWERMPRVLKCKDPRKAVVFFWSCDNPYGAPVNVAMETRTVAPAEVKTRFYGMPTKSFSAVFAKFKRSVHVVSAAAVPEEGTDFMLCDPAGDRNFCMGWFRVTRECVFAVREWPGNYYIPGVGVPGPWAVPSGKNGGKNDGARGDGQKSFGFGLLRYKYEIARLERWPAFLEWAERAGIDEDMTDAVPDDDEVANWMDPASTGVKCDRRTQVVFERVMDPRGAENPKQGMAGPVTLASEFEEIGMEFSMAPGTGVQEGLQQVVTALDYQEHERTGFLNSPKLKFSDACENMIFAMETYMGMDGEKGACKDMIDLVRYLFRYGCQYQGPHARRRMDRVQVMGGAGGSVYGTRSRGVTAGAGVWVDEQGKIRMRMPGIRRDDT